MSDKQEHEQSGQGYNSAAGMMAAFDMVARSLENDTERAKYWCGLGLGTVGKIRELIDNSPQLQRGGRELHKLADDAVLQIRSHMARWNNEFYESGKNKGNRDA